MGKKRIFCRNSKIKVRGVSRRGKRGKKSQKPKKPKATWPKSTKPKGHKLTIFYKGISPIDVFKFMGSGSEKRAKDFLKSKKEDTSIARINLEKIGS